MVVAFCPWKTENKIKYAFIVSPKKEVKSCHACLVYTLCSTVRTEKEQTRETGSAAIASLESENMDQAHMNIGLIWFSGEQLYSGI